MERTLRISDTCIGCGQCAKVCIRGHLAIEDGKAVEVESPYSCFRCGHCMAVCPKGAIAMRDSADELQEARAGPPVPPGPWRSCTARGAASAGSTGDAPGGSWRN